MIYIDTENHNNYLSERVGKCEYYHTPREYFTDNPWLREKSDVCSFVQIHRVNEQMNKPSPRSICTLPERVVEQSLSNGVRADHVKWLINTYGIVEAERVAKMYSIGSTEQGRTIFWQRDIEGRVRAGKIMAYDPITGHRLKEQGAIGWVHAILRREGALPEEWELTQSLYGEHLLRQYPDKIVAVVEAYKTAHVGAILMPDMVWLATDSLQGLTAERLASLKGRRVLFFPDEGKGYELWHDRLPQIAKEVGFRYQLSSFMEGKEEGGDIADLVGAEEKCPF